MMLLMNCTGAQVRAWLSCVIIMMMCASCCLSVSGPPGPPLPPMVSTNYSDTVYYCNSGSSVFSPRWKVPGWHWGGLLVTQHSAFTVGYGDAGGARVVRLDSNGTTVVFSDASDGVASDCIAGNDTRLVLAANTGLVIVDAATGSSKAITDYGPIRSVLSGSDGVLVAVSKSGVLWTGNLESLTLRKVDTGVVRITSFVQVIGDWALGRDDQHALRAIALTDNPGECPAAPIGKRVTALLEHDGTMIDVVSNSDWGVLQTSINRCDGTGSYFYGSYAVGFVDFLPLAHPLEQQSP